MQVKKFEARTMKEALEMVKRQLGPEAIILSAKDNRNRFGLVGDMSVEITAAVSEETLRKKQFTESRMNAQDREKFGSITAKSQKQVMNNFVNHYKTSQEPETRSNTRSSVRYIDIDEKPDLRKPEYRTDSKPAPVDKNEDNIARSRIRNAAQRAWGAFTEVTKELPEPTEIVRPNSPQATNAEVMGLKSEIQELKTLISQFQKVPDIIGGTFPGADFGVQYHCSSLFQRLSRAGVHQEVAGEILRLLQGQLPLERQRDPSVMEGLVVRYLLQSIKTSGLTEDRKVQLFVGPQGSGKTSALIKLASQYLIRDKKKVALVTTDTQRIGSAEQLRIYAQILNVPFAIVRSPKEWPQLLQALSGYDAILCDYAGSSLSSEREINELAAKLPPETMKAQVHLVLRLNMRSEEMQEIWRRYSQFQPMDFIFNGLDEALAHGQMLSLLYSTQLPARSLGTGPRVPEDYENASVERIVDLVFHLSSQYQMQEKSL